MLLADGLTASPSSGSKLQASNCERVLSDSERTSEAYSGDGHIRSFWLQLLEGRPRAGESCDQLAGFNLWTWTWRALNGLR